MQSAIPHKRLKELVVGEGHSRVHVAVTREIVNRVTQPAVGVTAFVDTSFQMDDPNLHCFADEAIDVSAGESLPGRSQGKEGEHRTNDAK
jgi:hypothetical protein